MMRKIMYWMLLSVSFLMCLFLHGVLAETPQTALNSAETEVSPTPTVSNGYSVLVIADYYDYGVQSVTSSSVKIAVGYKSEYRPFLDGQPVPDYLFTLKYWEEGSTEVHYVDQVILLSYPSRVEKTITGLKPGTKYYYQFHSEPINSFTTLKDNDLKYSVAFDINNYSGGSTTHVTITNLSDQTLKDWKLTWTFNEAAQINQLWCGKYTQSSKQVVVTPLEWNKEIGPKASISLGFCTTGSITKPTNQALEAGNNVIEEPVITPPDVTTLVNANSQFAFDIFKRLNATETGNNVFISPFSISTALAMVYQGAANDTKDEIAGALSYQGIDVSILNSNYKSLLSYLQSVDSFVTLDIGNSIWYQEGFQVKSDFLNTNQEVFQAEIQGLDLTKDDAADSINNWISNLTRGKIDKMVSPPLSGIMYLINAIYFKGAWAEPFDPKKTVKSTFTTESGESNTVDLMQRMEDTEFGKGKDFSAIRLPYGKEKVSMYCILPTQGLSIDSFISGLSVDKFNEIKQSLSARSDFSVHLPKFKMTYGTKSLKSALQALGMNQSFTGAADFSGITTEPIWVGDVLHKAVIDVNEQGTEAAAATVVVMVNAIQDYFHATRPFIFLIVDDTTGAILFLGKAADLAEY